MIIFICHHTNEEGDPSSGKIGTDTVYKSLYPIGIMRAVNDDKRVFGEKFKTTRPGHAFKTEMDCPLRDFPALPTERIDDIQHHHRIFELIVSKQTECKILVITIREGLSFSECFPGNRSGSKRRRICDGKGSIPGLTAGADDSLDGRCLMVEHHISAGLHNACLFPGDFFQGIPQNLRMLETDVHDRRAFRN